MNPTASSLARAMACPASEVLLQRVSSSSAYAARGTSLHSFVRKVIRGVPIEDAIVHVVDKWKPTARAIDFRTLTLGLQDLRSEQAFAIDPSSQTVRFLGEDIGRNYPETAPTEYVGTEDIGALGYKGMPVSIDLKTGWQPVDSPDENAQVKFFVARAHLATGENRVEGRIAYLRESGAIRFDRHEFTRMEVEDYLDDLDALTPRLAEAREQAADGRLTAFPGDHCKYCQAASCCPAKVGMARWLAGAALSDISSMLTALTPEQKAVAWGKAREIESLVDTVLKGLKECAKQEAFLTQGGTKQVREIRFPQARFVQERAIETMHKLGATREQIDECYAEAEVSQVRELNAPALPGGKAKKTRALRSA